jgi:hypothetical protein
MFASAARFATAAPRPPWLAIRRGRSIALIGQSNFSVAGRSENGGNDLTCNVLISGAHSHHSDKVDFEDEVFHGGDPPPH